MRLQKGSLYVVHKTSNELGDRLFHGTVLVCVFSFWQGYWLFRFLWAPYYFTPYSSMENAWKKSLFCPTPCKDLWITTFSVGKHKNYVKYIYENEASKVTCKYNSYC